MPPTASAISSAPPRLTQSLLLILSVAGAVIVANLYYNQPLLAQIAHGYGVTSGQVGIIPTFTQVGYATGLLTLVPLGDMLDRRRLIVTLLLIVTVALTAASFAPSLGVLAFASYAIGVSNVSPQIIVPFAAQLATPAQRGRAIGTVISGILIGILLSRTVSGFVGEAFGWRTMYRIAAGLMIVLAILLRFALPSHPPTERLSYAQLMRSVARLIPEQPVLRESAVVGALLFGSFSAFWATLVFLLKSPAYGYGERTVGLFGLVGAVGALAAPLVGRLTDRRSPRQIVGAMMLVTLASFVVLGVFGAQLWGLIAGVILLDLGVQAAQVANQARVYSLLPDAHSRLNTVYMVTYFTGGSLGSFLGAVGWSRGGWSGVCLVGVGMVSLALCVHLLTGSKKIFGQD